MNDFVKAVAAAYGSGDPNLHQIGEKALAELAAIRGEARTQEEMIRQLLSRAPKAAPVIKPPIPVVPVIEPESPAGGPARNGSVTQVTLNGKLTDEMKELIRELWTTEYSGSRQELNAQEPNRRCWDRDPCGKAAGQRAAAPVGCLAGGAYESRSPVTCR